MCTICIINWPRNFYLYFFLVVATVVVFHFFRSPSLALSLSIALLIVRIRVLLFFHCEPLYYSRFSTFQTANHLTTLQNIYFRMLSFNYCPECCLPFHTRVNDGTFLFYDFYYCCCCSLLLLMLLNLPLLLSNTNTTAVLFWHLFIKHWDDESRVHYNVAVENEEKKERS